MLTHRIIPCLDVHAGRVVKGVNFVNLRDAGDPVQIARAYDEAGADELVFLDITASHEGRQIMLDVVRQVAEQCFMPFTVGGGIRTIDDVTALVQAGAEKVSINTAAVVDPDTVSQTAARFGRCATVVNIDPKRVSREEFEKRRAKSETGGRGWSAAEIHRQAGSRRGAGANEQLDATSGDPPGPRASGESGYVFEVHTHGGRKPTGIEAVDWARRVVELGAGEIVLTSMDADGTRDGYDLEMTAAVAAAVAVPVVASGGCGSPEHICRVLTETDADAALAASIFHYGHYTIQDTKQYLAEIGVPVRLGG